MVTATCRIMETALQREMLQIIKVTNIPRKFLGDFQTKNVLLTIIMLFGHNHRNRRKKLEIYAAFLDTTEALILYVLANDK